MLHVKAIYWAYIDNIRIDIRRKCVSLFLVCNPLIILCQTSFDMTYKEGNYFITSSMNNGEFKQQVQIYSILFKKHSLGVENSSFFLGLLLISCIYRVIC